MGDFIAATASNLTFNELLFENLQLFSSGAAGFVTLFVVDTLFQQNFFMTINNSIFSNLTHSIYVLPLFISVTTNYQTNITFANVSLINCNFPSTILISLTKVFYIFISNFMVENSCFMGALALTNSQSLKINTSVFQNNNKYFSKDILNCGPALAIQDVFVSYIIGFQVLYSRGDISTLGILLMLPNSLHKGSSSLFILENSLFIGNLAYFSGSLIYGGCAIHVVTDMQTSISIANTTFQDNQIEVTLTAMEIVGAAAIRSMETGESISLMKCNFNNHTTSHLSSTIWFQGIKLIIIGILLYFLNKFPRFQVFRQQSLSFFRPNHWIRNCCFLWRKFGGKLQ